MRTSRASRCAHRRGDARDSSASCSSSRRSAAGCSRISARNRAPRLVRRPFSAGDTCLPPTRRARPRACRRARRRRPGRPGRAARRRAGRGSRAGTALAARERVLERDAERERGCGRPRSSSARCRRGRRPRARTTPSATSISDLAERVGAVAEPRAGDRVGDERDPARRRRATASRTISGSRWTPSTIDLDDDVGRARAPRRRCPGRGGASGRIALKRCVTVRTPRSKAACRLVGGRVRVPERDRDAARVQEVDQLERARELGRERHRAAPALRASSRSSSAGSGSRRARRRCVPRRAGERNGPSRCDAEDARARACRVGTACERRARGRSSGDVMNVGR